MHAPMRKNLAGLVGLLAVAGLTGATAPSAQAAPQAGTVTAQGTVWQIWNNYHGLFLDSDAAGGVYAIPGNGGLNQKWAERAGDRRSNVATGLCLSLNTGSETGSIMARTAPCQEGDTRQQWVHESRPGGVWIRSKWNSNLCLTSGDATYNNLGARTVYADLCWSGDKEQLWSVRAV